MRRRRLIWRIFPAYLVITLAALSGVTWYATQSLRTFSHDETEADLRSRARLLEDRAAGLLAADAAALEALCRDLGKRSSTRITVMLPSGKVVADSDEDPTVMENHASQDRPEMMAALAGGEGVSIRYSQTLRKDMMYFAIPLGRDGKLAGVLRTSIPVTSIERALSPVHGNLAIAGIVVAAFAAVVSLFVARRIAGPLEEMKRGADRFAEGDLARRLPVPDTEELASLAEAMNQMATQLGGRLRTILEERNEHEAILSSMIEGVLAVDTDERVIRVNQGAVAMLGLDAEAVEGRSIQEAVRNPALQRFVAEALASSGPVEAEIDLARNGGRMLQAHGATLRDAGGCAIGAVIVLNDVTHLRRLQGVRREFVANVSHELKTPITSIKGFVETLVDGALRDPDDTRRFLGIIANQVDRLNAIVDDLLLLSRLEEDGSRPEMTLEAGSVKEVIDGALEVCGIKAAERNITVDVACDAALTAPMNHALLEQAVINLVDNALTYSDPDSRVTVQAAAAGDEIVLAVSDEGCGIAAEHLPRLFERFYRVDKARSRKLGGTGLGLAIVKHIAQVHGARVTVDSTPGRGSTFRLHLPA